MRGNRIMPAAHSSTEKMPMRSILTCVMIAYASFATAHDAGTGWSYDPYCCNGNAENGRVMQPI